MKPGDHVEILAPGPWRGHGWVVKEEPPGHLMVAQYPQDDYGFIFRADELRPA